MLKAYQGLNSKGKTAFLAANGFTSEADIYRGLTAYLPKDVPITPTTLNFFANQNMQNPFPLIQQMVVGQGKQLGAQENQLASLFTSLGAQAQKVPQGLNPMQQMVWALMQGGSIGESKAALKELGAATAPTGGTGFNTASQLGLPQ
jgi:hypothetical protein